MAKNSVLSFLTDNSRFVISFSLTYSLSSTCITRKNQHLRFLPLFPRLFFVLYITRIWLVSVSGVAYWNIHKNIANCEEIVNFCTEYLQNITNRSPKRHKLETHFLPYLCPLWFCHAKPHFESPDIRRQNRTSEKVVKLYLFRKVFASRIQLKTN